VPGFLHNPQNDIDNIRDLLKGYGNTPSLIKELIQNAEDAEATRFELHYLPEDLEAAALHPLLEGPALVAINNGPFTEANREAIFSIGSGTKAADDRRIGRFGKGLKSVFALCEAFFLIGSEEATTGWKDNIWFMNPYAGWKHADWEKTFQDNLHDTRAHLHQHLATRGWDAGTWLAFWFPLRHANHLKDAQGARISAIHHWGNNRELMPAEDREFESTMRATFSALPERILLLRNLKQLAFQGTDGSGAIRMLYADDCIRCLPADEPVEQHWISGKVLGHANLHYQGITGRLADKVLEDCHQRQDWPRVGDPTGERDSVPLKGQPHFGCVFATQATALAPTLQIYWSVFLPVVEQPDPDPLPLVEELWRTPVTLILHGSFFLDSSRIRIDGLTDVGFENTRKNIRETRDGTNEAPLIWNQALAELGPLSHLPEALASFVSDAQASADAISNLVQCLRQTNLWQRYKEAICRRHSFVYRYSHGRGRWELVPNATPIIRLALPRGFEARDLWQTFPALADYEDIHALLVSEEPENGLILSENAMQPGEDMIRDMLQAPRLDSERSRRLLIEWLIHLLEGKQPSHEVRAQLHRLPLIELETLGNGERKWESADACKELLNEPPTLFRATDRSRKYGELLARVVKQPQVSLCNTQPELLRLLGIEVPELEIEAVGKLVLLCNNLQGSVEDRLALIGFVREKSKQQDPILRQAIRYLMHSDPSKRNEGSTTLLYQGNQGDAWLWEKHFAHLTSQIGGDTAWRQIDAKYGQGIPQQLLTDLAVRAVDAKVCLDEMKRAQAVLGLLSFEDEDWNEGSLEDLVAGLYDADRSSATEQLLRRLPIHIRLGKDSHERVAIGDEAGALLPKVLLIPEDFELGFKGDLLEAWESFCERCVVVRQYPDSSRASHAQKHLFHHGNDRGSRDVMGTIWNQIVSMIVDLPDCHRFVLLVLEGLKLKGGEAISGIGDKVKKAMLFEDRDGSRFYGDNLLMLDGHDDFIEAVFSGDSQTVLSSHLPDWLTKHPGFTKNRLSLFPQPHEVIRRLGERMGDLPEWYLGLSKNQLPEGIITEHLNALQDCEAVQVAKPLKALLESKPGGLKEEDCFKHVVHPVAQRWPDSNGYEKRMLTVLNHLRSQSTATHDLYLKQCVSDGRIDNILPQLHLRNQGRDWMPTDELIWPTTGPDPKYQLHENLAKILQPEGSSDDSIPGIDSNQANPQNLKALDPKHLPNPDTNACELVKYLESFAKIDDYPILAASFLTVCHNHPAFRQFADKQLDPLGQKFDTLREQLFGGKGAGTKFAFYQREAIWDRIHFVFRFVNVEDEVEFETVAGGTRTIPLSHEISEWVVDASRMKKPLGCWKEKRVVEVALRRIQHPEALPNQADIWRRTLMWIARNGYGLALCPDFSSLELKLNKHYGLRRVQELLLDGIEHRIKEIRCHQEPPMDAIIKDLDGAMQLRVDSKDYEEQGEPEMLEKAKALRDQAEKQRLKAIETMRQVLAGALGNPAEARLIEGLRHRLKDLQYSANSVLRELFQNADDALVERLEQDKSDVPVSFHVRNDSTNPAWAIWHWGRGINDAMGINPNDSKAKRYRRDLEKMLCLNLSDKDNNQSGGMGITGRFGLGFKSVYFLTDHPHIQSAALRCRIRGGFFPEHMNAESISTMERWSNTIDPSNGATLFVLEGLKLDARESDRLLEDFQIIARYLVHFARAIRGIEINGRKFQARGFESLHASDPWQLVDNDDSHSLLVFPKQGVTGGAAGWIMALNSKGFTAVESGIPRIWVTAPTQEPSQANLLVNGDWKVDAGRLRLARQSRENLQVAQACAKSLLIGLRALAEKSIADGQSLRAAWKLDREVDHYALWESFWEMVKPGESVQDWQEVINGADPIQSMLWNREFGVIPQLMQEYALLPSGIPHGAHRCLLRSDSIRACLDGVLDKEDELRKCCLDEWDVHELLAPGEIVAGSIAKQIEGAGIRNGSGPVPRIGLAMVLKHLLGPGLKVDEGKALQLGSILNTEWWKKMLNEHKKESDELRVQVLARCQFPTAAGGFGSSSRLRMCNADTGFQQRHRLKDEILIAAFAPDEQVLSADFTQEGLEFFLLCRYAVSGEKQIALGQEVCDWARAATGIKLESVIQYLLEGDKNHTHELAGELGKAWFQKISQSGVYGKLADENKKKLRHLFEIDQPIETEEPELSDAPPQLAPSEALQKIANWWKRERHHQLPRYLEKDYGSLTPQNLALPGDDAWGFRGDAQNLQSRKEWMVLCIHAALVTHGFYKTGLHKKFVVDMDDAGYLDTLANPYANPEDYTKIIDDFLGEKSRLIQYYHNMRAFISFYAASKFLDTMLTSLSEIQKKKDPWDLSHAFSIGLDPAFQGTGIRAPSLVRTFGMGAHMILRELYRVGKLTQPSGFQHAYFLPKRVRRFCHGVFGMNGDDDEKFEHVTSTALFECMNDIRAQSKIEVDITFGACFDIPLSILAADKKLSSQVVKFEIGDENDDTEEDEDLLQQWQ